MIHGASNVAPDHDVVVFEWATTWGRCYDCGVPAAYVIGQRPAYASDVRDEAKRCSVCAAYLASQGEELTYLFDEEFEKERG